MDPIIIVVIVGTFFIFKLLTGRTSLKSADAKKIVSEGGKIVDVRSPGEYKSGHFKGAINIQHDKIINGAKKAKLNKDSPIILYCASGARSSVAKRMLQSEGYTNIHNAGTQGKLKNLLS